MHSTQSLNQICILRILWRRATQVSSQTLMQQYNLLDRTAVDLTSCTIGKGVDTTSWFYFFPLSISFWIEFINANKLEQDHPCVIDIIRRFYLHPPASINKPIRLDDPDKMDPSEGQVTDILKHLRHRHQVTGHVKTWIANKCANLRELGVFSVGRILRRSRRLQRRVLIQHALPREILELDWNSYRTEWGSI